MNVGVCLPLNRVPSKYKLCHCCCVTGEEQIHCMFMDSPCAACRMLHRRCNAKCMLAPYFPANEPRRFAAVHKVFGASNVIKILQRVEEERRDDAVKALVYEAYARLRDPVYGSTGAIFYLQKSVEDLESQLRETQEQVLQSREQIDQLMNFLRNKELT